MLLAMASRLDWAGPWDPCSAGQADDQPHEADTEDRADKGEAARVVGVGLGEDVGGRQIQEHAREEAEVQPEELVRDGEGERAGGTDDRGQGIGNQQGEGTPAVVPVQRGDGYRC